MSSVVDPAAVQSTLDSLRSGRLAADDLMRSLRVLDRLIKAKLDPIWTPGFNQDLTVIVRGAKTRSVKFQGLAVDD